MRLVASVHSPGAMAGDPAPYAGPDSFTFVRVRITDADGATGDGFTGRFLAAEVAHLLNGAVRSALPEAGPDPIPALCRRLNPRNMTGVAVSALSALDIALADLAAKRAGVSLAAWLGGTRTAAPVHVTCGFPALDTDALVAACAREVAAGARGVKVLVAAKGRTIAEDAARLRAVREGIGRDAELIADANCGWSLAEAHEFARAVEDLELAWLEEPIRGNDRHALARLAGATPVPLGAGQMEQSAERFDLLTEAGLSVLQPNAVFAGGIAAAAAIATRAQAAGCDVSPGGGWDLVNLHWMCGRLPDGAVELHRAQARIARLLLAGDPALRDGCLAVPARPGLGLEPDEAALAACRVA